MLDIEKSLLGHGTNLDSFSRMWDLGLRREHFVDPLNQEVFQFVQDYWFDSKMGKVPTPEVLEQEWAAYTYVQPEESITWLVEKAKERYATNHIQNIIKDAARASTSGDPLEAVKMMYDQTWELSQELTMRAGRVNLATSIDERRKRFEERALYKDIIRGAPLGLPEIDQHTNGLLPGELAALVGFAKTGKSFALAKTAIECRKAGYTPYLATLELSTEDFSDRLDAMMSGIAYGKIQKASLDMDEIKRLHQAQEELQELGPLYIEKPPRGERTVQYLVNRARQMGADVILIDQLSFIESRKEYKEKKGSVDEIIVDLKNEISEDKSGSLPCFLAVQFNRASMENQGGRGGMHNIGLSSMIEQTVDIAYGLSRPREYRANNSLLMDIIGSRRSDIGSWLLKWSLDEETDIGVRSMIEESLA